MGYVPKIKISEEAHIKLRSLNARREEKIGDLATRLLEEKISEEYRKKIAKELE